MISAVHVGRHWSHLNFTRLKYFLIATYSHFRQLCLCLPPFALFSVVLTKVLTPKYDLIFRVIQVCSVSFRNKEQFHYG